MIPENAIPRPTAAVAIAVIRGARTVREIAGAVDRALASTHRALRKARQLELIDWEDEHDGTIHPVVEIVAASPRSRR